MTIKNGFGEFVAPKRGKDADIEVDPLGLVLTFHGKPRLLAQRLVQVTQLRGKTAQKIIDCVLAYR